MSVSSVIIDALTHALASKGSARIAFPGGRSAVALMDQLSQTELDWSSVNVTLVDERAVDESSDASNARLVKEKLLIQHAKSAKFEPLFIGDDATEAVSVLNQREATLDVVVLGMGEDGHFASLFPSDTPVTGLADTLDGFVATEAVGSPTVPRISMTLTRILSAELVVLLVSSEEKKDKVMNGLIAMNPMNPVSYLLASDHPVVVAWPDGEIVTIQRGVIHESK